MKCDALSPATNLSAPQGGKKKRGLKRRKNLGAAAAEMPHASHAPTARNLKIEFWAFEMWFPSGVAVPRLSKQGFKRYCSPKKSSYPEGEMTKFCQLGPK